MSYTQQPIPASGRTNKGALGGTCYRAACAETGATWYNRVTLRHYCRHCASQINSYTLADTGQAICTLVLNPSPSRERY